MLTAQSLPRDCISLRALSHLSYYTAERPAMPCPRNGPSTSFVQPFCAGLSHNHSTLHVQLSCGLKPSSPLHPINPFFPSSLAHPP